MTKRKAHPEQTPPNETQAAAEPAPEPPMSPATAAMVADLKAQLDEAVGARQRALADFANYQRRAADNEVQAHQSGASGVIRSLLGVLDHFDLAISQDQEQVTVDQLLGGVRIVQDEFRKVLESHGVKRVQPEVGEPFDPHFHEAVLRQPAEGLEPNDIVSVLQPGYTLGKLVLRPAKVVVAGDPGS